MTASWIAFGEHSRPGCGSSAARRRNWLLTASDSLGIQDPFRAWADIPAEVQATVRTSEAERFCFLLNFTNESKTITFNKPTLDLLEERELRDQAEVPPYGVRVVRL